MPALGTATLRDDFLAALLAGDSTRARHLVEQATESGMDVPTIYLDVLEPALEEIGELWACGEIGVAREHHATAVTQGIIGAIGPRMRVPPTSGRLAVLGCTPGELHALGPTMLGDFLEAAGWEVLQLGASVPVESLVTLAADECPDAVILSTATPSQLPAAAEAIARLQEIEPRPFVVVGGRAWRGREDRCPADACIGDPRRLVALLTERFPDVPEDDAA